MLRANLWNKSVSRVELDQRAREARLRLERIERQLLPRALTRSPLKRLLYLCRGGIFVSVSRESRTRGPLSDRRPSRMPTIHHVWVAEWRSSLTQNPGDLAGGNPVDLGNLGNRHAVLHQGADTHELRSRDLTRRLGLGSDRNFERLVTDWHRRRDYSQHTRFAGRLVGWRRGRY